MSKKVSRYNYGREALKELGNKPQTMMMGEANFLTEETSKSVGRIMGVDDPNSIRIPRRAKAGETVSDYAEIIFKHREEKEKANPDLSLIDEWMAGTYQLPKLVKKSLAYNRKRQEAIESDCLAQRALIKRAARFTLDDEFVEMATRVAATVKPEKLKQMIQMATLPYEVTYLEFNLHVKVKTSAEVVYPGQDFEPHATVPKRLGLLLKRDMIRPTAWVMYLVGPISFREDHMEECVTTLSNVYLFDAAEALDIHVNGAAGVKPFIRTANIRLEGMGAAELLKGMKAMSWGYSFKSLLDPDEPQEEKVSETFRRLAANTPPELAPHSDLSVNRFYEAVLDAVLEKKHSDQTSIIQSWFLDWAISLKENAGILRWVAVVLAMLNEVPTTSAHVVKPGSQRIGLSHKNLLDYHRLSLKLPKTRPVQFLERKLTHAIAAKKRAHEVRSHWRTYQSELSCKTGEHVWEYDHPNGYRLCGKCESYGRLIPEHVRGDETLGWVRKDYILQSNPEAKV